MKIPAAKIYFPEEDKAEILKKVEEILTTGRLTLGEYGRDFEKEFSRYIGAKYAIAVNSGTSALEICLRIIGVEGKEVIVPTNTFFATAAAVLHAGGKIRFVDVEKNAFSIDVDDLKRAINRRTAGIILVHIGGIITSNIEDIQRICEEKGIFLLEDAAHAQGSSFNGKMAGTFGKAACFSFYPTKVITSGEGGMIVTDDKKIYEEALIYRDQGKAGFYGNIHTRLGYNWRMSEIHAVVGLYQLRRIEEFIEGRNRVARVYDEGLEKIPGISRLKLSEKLRCNYYKYIALLENEINRTKLKKTLKEDYGISLSGEVYELPCHLQPVFKDLSKEDTFPVAEDICSRHICLPIYPTMTQEEAESVLTSLRDALERDF